MKSCTRYAIVTVEHGIARHYQTKTMRNARKYITKGAQSIFREQTNKKGWFQELVWSCFD